MPHYRTEELNQRVVGVEPDMFTRFKWRAERRAEKLNSQRVIKSYRYEVVDWLNGKWAVVAMQNQLVPDDR